MTQTQPDNIVRTGQTSRTALRVAALRAVHAMLDEPIVLSDPIALPILGSQLAAELTADPFQHNDPISRGLRASVVVRSRFAEDELARAVAAGVRQYVILGAGLDTFAYRNPHVGSALRVFEVDHPSTQAWKRQLLADAGIALPENLTFAPVDFENSTLAQGLLTAGFQPELPACFSWLGVTVYLSETAIMQILGYVAGLANGSSIAFDFRAKAANLGAIERAVSDYIGQRAAEFGEPWVSAFDPAALQEQVRALGFRDVEIFEPDALNRRYLFRRKDGLRTTTRLLLARV
ncbi:MAG: class I SAM-dependent methyltransferase [Hyphomicrobiales bacterium]|nr:class I SAM-dependent methyltransferase [Hyphomicrobiales bacterium]MDE2113970.1 class I SAM-dependent methyltransferase [Hyphomicrobiales bacterium]